MLEVLGGEGREGKKRKGEGRGGRGEVMKV